MRNLILNLIQKHFLEQSSIKPGDLVQSIYDDTVVYECIGIYYNYQLRPFVFFRTEDGHIASRPLNEVNRCNNIERITKGVL